MPRGRLVSVVASVVLFAGVATVPAEAASSGRDSTAATLSQTSGVIDGVAISERAGKFFSASGSTSVSMPSNASGSVEIDSASSASRFSIGIPGGVGEKGVKIGDAVIYGEVAQDSDVAVKFGSDGSTQLLVSMKSRTAPEGFPFPLSLPTGTRLAKNPDGSVSLVRTLTLPDGTHAEIETGRIDVPWAVDSRGRAVKTWFEVAGNVLTQHVQHSVSSAYPVVADPHFTVGCGRFACGVRFDRAWTRNARDAAWVASVGAAVCALITGPGAVGCAVAWGLQTVVIAVAAGRYYEDGDCLGMNKPHVANVWAPFRVSAGTANCR